MRLVRFWLWLWVCLAGLASFVGCAPGGGGGGGDCREAEHGCSEGFSCVAAFGGASYACRAVCTDDGQCLRDESCQDGLCADRPGRVADARVDAEVDAEVDVAVVDPPAPDAEVDGPPIRVVDAEPPPVDRGVVVLPPLDGGVDPGECAGRFDASGRWIAGIAFGFEPDEPVFYRVEVEMAADRRSMSMQFAPLRTRDRSVIEARTVEVAGVDIDADGRFETGTVVLDSPIEANRLGGALVFEIDLIGALRPAGALCGIGEGVTVQPRGRSLDGTVFALARWREPVAAIDPFAACDGCLR